MSLRNRAILMVFVAFAVALAITLVVSQTMLMKRFAGLERENATQNTERVVSALYKDFTSISLTPGAEAFQSKSFEWVQDEGGARLEVNFDEPSLEALNINFVAIIMVPGEAPLHIRGYDMQTHQTVAFPAGFDEALAQTDNPLVTPVTDNASVTGILVLPDTALLVQSFPIDISTEYGYIHGRTIMARFLDDAEVGRLAEQTHLSLKACRWDDSEMPEDFLAARGRLSQQDPVATCPLGGDTVAGYGLLNDVYGNPAMIMRADMPRDIYHEGQQTVYWLIACLAAIFVVFAVAVVIAMNRVILSRLLGLSRGVDSVRETSDLTERVAVKGKDEVSRLGEAINGMLASLDRSQHELAQREAEKRALLNAIPDLMFRVRDDGTILDARAAEEGGPHRTQIRAGDVKPYQELPQYRVLSAEVVGRGLPLVKQALQTGETQMFEVQISLNDDMAFYEARVAPSREDEALVMVRDVTERKQAEKRLEYISSHDALSGLYNRAHFESEFARMEHSQGFFPVSVIMVDVDGMKAVNDTKGHDAGDEFLRRAATVLGAAFRAEDVVSRIGGDEFAVLLPGADVHAGERALARVREILAIHNGNTQGIPLSLSLGVATGDEGSTLAEIMREADNRMYREKLTKKVISSSAGHQPARWQPRGPMG